MPHPFQSQSLHSRLQARLSRRQSSVGRQSNTLHSSALGSSSQNASNASSYAAAALSTPELSATTAAPFASLLYAPSGSPASARFSTPTPTTCTPSVRVLGPSNSTSITLCHVPSASSPSTTGMVSLLPINIDRRCECAFSGSCALHAASPPGQSGGPLLRWRSLWRYGSPGGASLVRYCRTSSMRRPSASLIVTAVVVCRERTFTTPFSIPAALTRARTSAVTSINWIPRSVAYSSRA
mmetsp:Transcript_14545/g.52344  ORF Transcript_14545/g.52344 Transcript_14545/m.52344 type:complete len:239 (-) Transcript_14545:350-1066(-)